MSIKTDFENGFMPKERAIKFINDFQNLDFENIEFETLKKLGFRIKNIKKTLDILF